MSRSWGGKSNQRAEHAHFIYSPQASLEPSVRNPSLQDRQKMQPPMSSYVVQPHPPLLANPLGNTATPDRFQDLTPHSCNGEGNALITNDTAGSASAIFPPDPLRVLPRGEAGKRAVGRRCAAAPSGSICPCQASARVVLLRRRRGRVLVRLFCAGVA